MSSRTRSSGSASRMAAVAFALEPRREVCNTGASTLFGMRATVCDELANEGSLLVCSVAVLPGSEGGAGGTQGSNRRRRDSIDSNGSEPAAGTRERAAFPRLGMMVSGGFHLVTVMLTVGARVTSKRVEPKKE